MPAAAPSLVARVRGTFTPFGLICLRLGPSPFPLSPQIRFLFATLLFAFPLFTSFFFFLGNSEKGGRGSEGEGTTRRAEGISIPISRCMRGNPGLAVSYPHGSRGTGSYPTRYPGHYPAIPTRASMPPTDRRGCFPAGFVLPSGRWRGNWLVAIRSQTDGTHARER